MMPVGPLMFEHRLIEKMIALMGKEVQKISQGLPPDTEFIRTAVDFIKTYADRLHHGKEEDILFRDLAKKRLSAEHKRIMDELVKEHALGRENTRKLVESRNKYLAGEKDLVKVIAENMGILVKFYPQHIEKEDKHFFLPVMDYFTKDEQSAMLAEFNDFDRQFIHDTYRNIISEWEKNEGKQITGKSIRSFGFTQLSNRCSCQPRHHQGIRDVLRQKYDE